MIKNKTILVTGGSGFIGTNLIDTLIKKRARVICIDNFYSSKKSNINKFLSNKNFKFIKKDITKKFILNDKIDGIFHLACPASPPIYQKDPIFTLNTNYLGTKNLLELAKLKKAKILLASTSEVYGDPLIHPQKETYFGNVNTLGPRACYDEGKRISEVLFYEYHKIFKLDIRIARIFNTYGPYLNKDDGRVVSNFINQAIKNEDITIFGDGSQSRSFCFISDLIEGLMKLYNYRKFDGAINFGNPSETSMNNFAKLVVKLTDSKSVIKKLKLPIDDPKKRKPDITKANKLLGWKPKVNLRDGLKKTILFYKTNNN